MVTKHLSPFSPEGLQQAGGGLGVWGLFGRCVTKMTKGQDGGIQPWSISQKARLNNQSRQAHVREGVVTVPEGGLTRL